MYILKSYVFKSYFKSTRLLLVVLLKNLYDTLAVLSHPARHPVVKKLGQTGNVQLIFPTVLWV